MAAITEVSLQNFRGFERLDRMRLAPLTFLVGPNSSGKSSVADAVLFMAQSGFLSLEGTDPIWIGPLVDLGSFKDTVFRHEVGRTIDVRATLYVGVMPRTDPLRPDTRNLEIAVQIKTAKGAPEGGLKRLSVSEAGGAKIGEMQRRGGRPGSFAVHAGSRTLTFLSGTGLWHSLFMDQQPVPVLGVTDIQRVSSGRNPPQRSYTRTGRSPGARVLLDGIDPVALEGNRKRLRATLAKGLGALGIADALDVARFSDYHTALNLRDNLTGVASNLAEFGYGASQVLPVLEGLASPGYGPLFIEQPEIHLHPRAQGALAQILCLASKKRQLIVETHSEHMINRARRLVAEGHMKAEDVVIQYVDRDKDGSHATMIELDAAGDFTRDWPDGFFDERYQETMKIAEAQSRRAAE